MLHKITADALCRAIREPSLRCQADITECEFAIAAHGEIAVELTPAPWQF